MKSRSFKFWIIAICSLVYFASYFARKDFAAAMAGMLADGVIERSVAGLVGTVLFAFYGVGQLISGYLGDKVKPAILITAGLGTTAVCNLLMPLVPNGWLMIPIWAINGLAQAMLWPPIVRILSDNLDHESFVGANTVVTAAAHVSTVLLYLYVPLCLKFFSWRTVFFTSSVLAFLVMVAEALALFIILPKNRPLSADSMRLDVAVSATPEPAPLRSVFFGTGVLFVLPSIISNGFLRDGIESWLPTLYSEAFEREASESVLVSVILPLFAVASILVVTALHKKRFFNNEIRGAAVLYAASAVCCALIALFVESDGPVLRVVCLVLAGLLCALMHGVNFLLISCMPGRFSHMHRASTVSGMCNASVYIGGAISMYGIALVSENMGWRATAIMWIAVAAFGAGMLIPAFRKYTKFISNR